jgi:class 3 adenylate cyclase
MSDHDIPALCPTCGAPIPPGARFCPSCGTPIPAVAPVGPEGRTPGSDQVAFQQERPTAAPRADELRPVTALFSDVVGSTALGERLGPDEVKALIGECVSRMSRAVEEFGGTVQAYMGDGICAYFGVPSAHEDDQERAARAALRILQLVGEYGRDIEAGWGIAGFNVRVGINSGLTAVGTVGAADPQEVALGDTTNVAARLQSAALPGTVAVGDAAARRLAAHFVLEPLGELPVKGRTEPVLAWRLVGPRSTLEAGPATTLVGRDGELARLAGVVDELVAGRGQVMVVTGEAGLGKTRMLAELHRVAGDRVTWLEGRCLSYGGELLYWPFVEMLRSWLGTAEGEAEVAVRTRLRTRIAPLMDAEYPDALSFLGRLLSVRLDAEPERDLHPPPADRLASGIRGAYVAWIERLAADRPVVVAVDDLQWADAATSDLAEDLLALTDRAPLLVAASLRADPGSEGWRFRLKVLSEYMHRAVELPLTPVARESAERLVDALMPVGILDPATRSEIVGRAEGNPLYVEELLRAVVESGVPDRRRTWTLPSTATGLIPPSLEGLFIARIDRLSPGARRLAQAAAVVGRSFPVRVLERLHDGKVEEDLAELLRAEIVRELRRYPELECTFRHGLVQEAALTTLTSTSRRELYGRVGDAFEQDVYAESVDEHLEELAFWFYRSDRPDRALAYLERAAERAESLDARPQAAELWTRARKVASRVGDEEAAARADARLARLDTEHSWKGYA